MVNNAPLRLISSDVCRLQRSGRDGLLIRNGPIYNLSLAQQLLKSHGFTVVNQKADKDMKHKFNPEMDDDELFDFVMKVHSERFAGSERCSTSNGMTVDCDSYAMCWNRYRRREWEYGQKIYVKFGFSEQDIDPMLILCIHPATR